MSLNLQSKQAFSVVLFKIRIKDMTTTLYLITELCDA